MKKYLKYANINENLATRRSLNYSIKIFLPTCTTETPFRHSNGVNHCQIEDVSMDLLLGPQYVIHCLINFEIQALKNIFLYQSAYPNVPGRLNKKYHIGILSLKMYIFRRAFVHFMHVSPSATHVGVIHSIKNVIQPMQTFLCKLELTICHTS